MPKRNRPKDSEVDAYVFIKENLQTLEWNAGNPLRVPGGQVFTQNQCLSDPEIKKHLGLLRPENIVKVSDSILWVIEAKRSHGELAQALIEAEDYARRLNNSKQFQALIISGVAGNEVDSYIIRTRFLVGTTFVPVKMNDVEVSGLLSPKDCDALISSGNASIDQPPIDEKLFFSRATHINEILHLGAVNPHKRASVMAALLLSMIGNTEPNTDERSTTVLIDDINTRVKSILREQKKAGFFEYIRIDPPSTQDNHVKFRQALVDTIQELRNLNIRSAMNSGSDVLGAFYEVFLKYASWAQDLGIVLTPRHITRYVADIMDVQANDIVFDPTCGTGGFLVAAFDYVKQNSDEKQLERFKRNGLFGVEQDSGVAALAIVNMIFRGDGKNNIIEANCFAQNLSPSVKDGIQTATYSPTASNEAPVTKVMMNPPFALKRGEDKEYRFVDHALKQMQHGGLLFAVLPYSSMVKGGGYKTWRQDILLNKHTLLAAVTLPGDLFYPVSVPAIGVFIRKGIPHPPSQKVLWARADRDGLVKSKGKRLPSFREPNYLDIIADDLRAFVRNPNRIVKDQPKFIKTARIDPDRHS